MTTWQGGEYDKDFQAPNQWQENLTHRSRDFRLYQEEMTRNSWKEAEGCSENQAKWASKFL